MAVFSADKTGRSFLDEVRHEKEVYQGPEKEGLDELSFLFQAKCFKSAEATYVKLLL